MKIAFIIFLAIAALLLTFFLFPQVRGIVAGVDTTNFDSFLTSYVGMLPIIFIGLGVLCSLWWWSNSKK